MSVNYDAIASAYDRRYRQNDYSGVEAALTAFVGSAFEARVLEVGCGTGHWLRLLRTTGIRAAGVDASIGMLAEAHCPVVRGVAEQLPWTTQSVDRLFCINAIHHFRNAPTFLAEAHRVLRPGGRVMTIGLDPHTGTDRWYIYDYFASAFDTDRRRYPAASQIREWMEAAGFTSCVTREVQHLPVRLSARTALEQGRLDRGITSQVSVLNDEEYAKGLARIRCDMEAAEKSGTSLFLTADLRLYATFGSLT